ncbi:hypothetical protein ACFP3U_28345 [Kitasatospora misakiensis]|uniref:Uncharacterized protein n=1 Tax=Kitasatospora misakiensis TaxID=67330 RepID=A0ABW0XFH5_9ACTN
MIAIVEQKRTLADEAFARDARPAAVLLRPAGAGKTADTTDALVDPLFADLGRTRGAAIRLFSPHIG